MTRVALLSLIAEGAPTSKGNLYPAFREWGKSSGLSLHLLTSNMRLSSPQNHLYAIFWASYEVAYPDPLQGGKIKYLCRFTQAVSGGLWSLESPLLGIKTSAF